MDLSPWLGIVAVLAGGLLASQTGCARDNEAPDEHTRETPLAQPTSDSTAESATLEKFSLGGPKDLAFTLSLDTCGGADCPFRLTLHRGDRNIDSIELAWSGGTDGATPIPGGGSFGAVDPLDDGAETTAWQANAVDVAVTAKPLQLAPNWYAILVHQTGGFDHVKRRHDVFAAVDDSLRLVWSTEEGAGPVWSAVLSADRAEAFPATLVHFYGRYFTAVDQLPDTLEATAFAWNDSRGEFIELAPDGGRPPMYLLIAGRFDSLSMARSHQEQALVCEDGLWVLAGESMPPAVQTKGFIVGALTTREDFASAALERLRACVEVEDSAILRYW